MAKEEKPKDDNITPLRKTDPLCYSKGGAIINALFIIQMALQCDDEEIEKETVTSLLETLAALFERYQETDLHGELIYRDFIKIQSMTESFYSEASACPKCRSFNVLVEETDEETTNTCLDCQHVYISDE